MELLIKAWHLKKGDQAKHGIDGELLTFQKMDGMYAQWKNEKGEIKCGQSEFYTKNEEGIYIG